MAKVSLAANQVMVEAKSAIYRIPRVIAYNRLETRTRTLDFSGSLRAEVRDPLWMLTRQWQFGEFQGEDAASPVTARIGYQHHAMDRVAFPDGQAFAFNPSDIPLETKIERERIPLTVREMADGTVYSNVLFAIQLGRKIQKMLVADGLGAHYSSYVDKFPIRVLPQPSGAGQPPRPLQDEEAEQVALSVAGQVADGVAIWRAVQTGTHDPWLDGLPGGDKIALKAHAATFADDFSKKIARLFSQPDSPTDTAWLKNHLEYQFSVGGTPVSSGGQPVLVADQYHEGRLDWYSFDAANRRNLPLNPEPVPPDEPEQVESFLPAPVKFKGQPQARFWEMEERQTDFGKIETSATGLLQLMLAEFGLIYSNDWFMLPHPMTINTLCEIRGIVVDDNFGRHTFVRSAGRGPETSWQRWAMFHLTEKEQSWAESNRFYLVPAVGKVLESEPLERVNFLRDEMANMVWVVENIIPSQMGKGMSGNEAARDNAPEEIFSPVDDQVKVRYVLGTTVPKNWIPFLPVHAEGSVSEIRLQRARMVGGEPPRGWLLREPRSPYFVEEEEVPRTGVLVDRSWQRARWMGGKTFVWVGRRKQAGRGEGWSNLVFDQISDIQENLEA